MYDVNDHPLQDQLNRAIASVLADTVKRLKIISEAYYVDGIALANQYKDSLELLISRYENGGHES